MSHKIFLFFVLSFLPRLVFAQAVRDEGRFFTPETTAKLEETISSLAATTTPPLHIFILTKNKVEGNLEEQVRNWAPTTTKQGVYVFISREPRKLLMIPSKGIKNQLASAQLQPIREGIVEAFRKQNFDAGILAGINQLSTVLKDTGTTVQKPSVAEPAAYPVVSENGSLMQRILVLIAIILGVAGLVRLLANLRRPRYPQPYGNPPYSQGNPTYPAGGFPQGGPSYGGGGGIWQSMFGGIAGAMAGNWMYDKFFGSHSAHGGVPQQDHFSSPPQQHSNSLPPTSADQGWSFGDSAGDFSNNDDWGGSSDSSGDDW